jgi:hypothetical protein
MKTHISFAPIAAGVGLILLLAPGCAPREKAVQVQSAPTPEKTVPAQPTVPVAKPVKVVPVAVNSPSVPAPVSWMDIKDFTFQERAAFLAGAAVLENTLAGQISELNAKRAVMTAETKDWDFAMKELNDSRDYLKSTIDEAGRATPESWGQEKDKVGTALQRAQDALEKVRMTTTS